MPALNSLLFDSYLAQARSQGTVSFISLGPLNSP